MQRRETSSRVTVPLARKEGDDTTELRLMELNVATGQSGRASKKSSVAIALIDPKPLTRRSIAEILAKALPDYVTVAASSCEKLLELKDRLIGSPHLIIVYIRSAGVADSCVQDALELVRLRLPEARVIVLSDRDDVDNINEALTCGVSGYIPTSVEAEVAFAALRLISAGGTYLPAQERRSPTAKPDNGAECERRGRSDELDLTPRELSVLDLLREGKPNKLIAAGLNMEESTVKVHVRNILKKLHAANRTQAASVANRLLGEQAPANIRLLRPASGGGMNSKSRHAEPVGG
jgi:DNA-binding NarL/FixJ family response regulator